MSSSAKWILLKEDGNKKYQAGDYEGAEALYTKAIIVNHENPILYTNRAMARLKLKMWDRVIDDCNECLRWSSTNMKAHYYLGQAHLELKNYDEAVKYALKAYNMCVETQDKSLLNVLSLVRSCKAKRWDDMERRRTREYADLESEVLAMLERERDAALAPEGGDGDSTPEPANDAAIRGEWESKLQAMREVFEKARSADSKRRKVPDWAIDDISFEFMHDPVVTKSGKSFERAVIRQHIQDKPQDPLTKEPLLLTDLRPNHALRDALEEFLAENGWAADY